MKAVAVNSYDGVAAVSLVTVEAPEVKADDEVRENFNCSKYLLGLKRFANGGLIYFMSTLY